MVFELMNEQFIDFLLFFIGTFIARRISVFGCIEMVITRYVLSVRHAQWIL
jgi:hypothetical protein